MNTAVGIGIGIAYGTSVTGNYNPGFSLTEPVLAFVSATTPSNDNTQDLTADFADSIVGNVIRLVGTFGSATVSEPYDIDASNTIDAGEDSAQEAAFTTGAIDDGVCSFKCRVEDGSGNALSDWSNTVTKTIDATAPTITSATTANNAENVVLAHALTANESVTWSLNGGADVALFEISGSTLRWASNGTKDYETPDDTGTNNVYNVTVRATDTAGNTTDQNIAITVTDVADTAAEWVPIAGSMQEIGYGSATVTWSSVAINSASTDTVLAFVLSSGRDITGVTIGGDAMTLLIENPTSGDNEQSIWYKVGAYTTPNIVATGSAAVENVGATFGKWSGASVVPSGGQGLDSAYRDDPKLLGSMTIPSGGVGLCMARTLDTAGLAFNNMTDGDIDSATSGNVRAYLLGSRTTAGAFQASFNTGENNYSGAVGCVLSPT